MPRTLTTVQDLRRRFNDGRYWERVRTGELKAQIRDDCVPRKLPRGEPRGTRSQIVLYRNATGRVVAIVHQYKRPDGTLGASRLPDPKFLVDETNDTTYYIERGSN
jgi:hypothetical protein